TLLLAGVARGAARRGLLPAPRAQRGPSPRARRSAADRAPARGMTAAADRAVVGVDYGTLSGRAVVVRAVDGEPLGEAEHAYRHGVMSETLAATGATLPPNWALQDPDDYVDVLREAVPAAVAAAGVDP